MIPAVIYIVIILLLILAIIWLVVKAKSHSEKDTRNREETFAKPEEVGAFYNEQTDNFMKVYGEVIQAFRTTDLSNLLNYQVAAMGLENGQKVLDAGCGVCGPARYFATKKDIHVEALTISEVQTRKSRQMNAEKGLENKITVTTGDYHHLTALYPQDSFDLIYFLESFGHAQNHQKVLDEAWGVLKPGGTIYIKDLFKKVASIPALEAEMQHALDNINSAYKYHVPDLNDILHFIRKKGYILSSVKTIDIPLEDFENLTISNDFQELTGINKIDNLQEYIFPVDFFEIKCIKPWNALEYGNSRYFLQNLYYMQVHHKKQEEL